MAGTCERLRVGRGHENTGGTIPTYAAKGTFLHARVTAVLPAMPVELTFFGYALDKLNIHNYSGRLARFSGVALGILSALYRCRQLREE